LKLETVSNVVVYDDYDGSFAPAKSMADVINQDVKPPWRSDQIVTGP